MTEQGRQEQFRVLGRQADVITPGDAADTMPRFCFELRGISKSFPGVRALRDVSFDIRSGEVHMLLGQNGAGKSSLMKILYGAYRPDTGEFIYEGERIQIASPADARRFGIAVIFQEFSLVPYLNIAQNIFLGREPRGRLPGTIDDERMHREAARLLDTLSLKLDTRTLVHTLGIGQQQLVEIAKALSQDARILVMDEPTAALSDRETERLFAVIRGLRAKGVAIVYISHRMSEVFELGDQITVLRDGQKVASLRPSETDQGKLVRLMIGGEVSGNVRSIASAVGAPAVEVKDLHTATGVNGVSLVIHQGEIVGLSGLVGAGRTEVARAIFGADPKTSGEIRVFGEELSGGPDAAVKLGLALVPESRKEEGLALQLSCSENLLASGLRATSSGFWFEAANVRRIALELIDRMRIATPSEKRPVKHLSGGNQQKIVIGKWLAAGSKFFIFDEPTRGIDVGAKAEIFAIIEGLVAEGAGVLMISSDLSEIVGVCHRSYVLREGRIVGDLRAEALTEENILNMVMSNE